MIWIPGVDFRHHEFISLCQAVPICSGNVGKLKYRVNYSPFLDCLVGFFFISLISFQKFKSLEDFGGISHL